MKNVILVVVIVACLAIAGFIVFGGGSGGSGIDSIPEGEQMWTLCMACQNAKQMAKRDYFEASNEKSAEMRAAGANPMAPVYLTCEKCGKDAVTRAVKCEKCGKVFRYGAMPDYSDKCPDCKYSPTEARFKERTGR